MSLVQMQLLLYLYFITMFYFTLKFCLVLLLSEFSYPSYQNAQISRGKSLLLIYHTQTHTRKHHLAL